MKNIFITYLLFTSPMICAMEAPVERDEVEIKFKDFILLPDGGHMRAIYHPLRKQIRVTSFDSDTRYLSGYLHPSFDSEKCQFPKNFELKKICGIAQYKHYLLYAVLGSSHHESDTIILGKQNNLDKGTAFSWALTPSNINYIDACSLIIAKEKLTVKGIGSNSTTNEIGYILSNFNKKLLMPDIE